MSAELLSAATTLALALLSVGMLAAFVRLLRGPSLADRVVALDAIAAMIVCCAATFAIRTDLAVFIDVALVIALVSFLGTIALAQAIEAGDHR